MAFNLRLPALLAKMRWKVKIRDKERVEDPHITVIRGTTVWRVPLRDGRFMDGGSWKDMPNDLQQVVQERWQELCAAWDRIYPHNPIQGKRATMMATKHKRLFLLGPGAKRLLRYGLPASQVQGRRSVVQALRQASPSLLWLAASAGASDELLQESLQLPAGRRGRFCGPLDAEPAANREHPAA